MINSELNFTLEEILPKFPKEFQEKIKEMEAKRHAYSGKKV